MSVFTEFIHNIYFKRGGGGRRSGGMEIDGGGLGRWHILVDDVWRFFGGSHPTKILSCPVYIFILSGTNIYIIFVRT